MAFLVNTFVSRFSQWGFIESATVNLISKRSYRSFLTSFSCSNYTTVAASADNDNDLVPERLYSKINVKVQSYEHAVLESYIKFIKTAGKALDIKIGGKVSLPTHIQKFTVIKSPHIYKKHRGQYEIRTHSRLVQIKEITGTTADVFLEYIQRNLPEGVTMTVYQERLEALPKVLMEHIIENKPNIEKTKTAKK